LYKINLIGIKPKNVYIELIDVFLRPDQYICVTDEVINERKEIEFEHYIEFCGENYNNNKNLIKQQIYLTLSELTGKKPEWGILTGIRPVKVAGELIRTSKSKEKAKTLLIDFYLLSEKKTNEIIEMHEHEYNLLGDADVNSVGIYIGIPFCPTRCVYCSFTSNIGNDNQISLYLEALHKEISFVGLEMQKKHQYPESIYLGGGTPTTISAFQLDQLLNLVENSFNLDRCAEITVEAGRPDTITKEKIEVLVKHKISRISINPQTMKNSTLKLIGRDHTAEEIVNAFELARNAGIKTINADIIAGLQKEDCVDFQDTLNKVIALGAENITVHTLSVKRASKLIDIDRLFHYKQEKVVCEMLDLAESLLADNGYRPYYLYRQKHMAGGLENVGYCKGNTDGIYNMRIMDEHQTIIALGAGGITKVYFPDENRLERVPNVSNYEIYIERINEMIKRKQDNLF
jgi:oxygen-independent coproporphyrinogen-3 oxidase